MLKVDFLSLMESLSTCIYAVNAAFMPNGWLPCNTSKVDNIFNVQICDVYSNCTYIIQSVYRRSLADVCTFLGAIAIFLGSIANSFLTSALIAFNSTCTYSWEINFKRHFGLLTYMCSTWSSYLFAKSSSLQKQIIVKQSGLQCTKCTPSKTASAKKSALI